MKKTNPLPKEDASAKKGYNEKNPGQPGGAFPPASMEENVIKKKIKSNAADKKYKEGLH